MLRVAMVVYGDIRHDSRVQREARWLADLGHRVTIHCIAGSQDDLRLLGGKVEVIAHGVPVGAIRPGSPSPFRMQMRIPKAGRIVRKALWIAGYVRSLRAWGRAILADAPQVDVWHAHDFTGLVAIAGSLQRSAALVYDVHDLFVDTGTGRLLPAPVRRVIQRYERHLVARADLVVAVNAPLAEVISRRCRPRSIIVVHNCPPRWVPPDPRPDLIRQAAGIPSEAPVILYHGQLGLGRGIEMLLEAILLRDLRDAHVALMGYGDQRERLAAASIEPQFGGRLHVLDPVPPSELLPWVASADVGSLAMPHASLNLYLSTPNKLFECLAAGTPVVVSDFPAVRAIVIDDPRGPLGEVCDPANPVDIARALRSVIAADRSARQDLRRRCSTAAQERWNWETEAGSLTAAYERLGATRRIDPGPPAT